MMDKQKQIHALLQQAIALHQQGELAKAVELYHRVLGLDDNNADAYHLLGLVALAQQNHPAALQSINKAIQLQPKQVVYYNSLMQVLIKLDAYQQAEQAYKLAKQLAPDYFEITINIVKLYYAQGRYVQALHFCQQGLITQPDNIVLLDLAAQLHIRLGRVEQGIAYLQQALHVQPHHAQSLNVLGKAYSYLGQFAKAQECFQQAVEHHPQHTLSFYNLSAIYKFVTLQDPLLLLMQDSLKKLHKQKKNITGLLYALGKAYDDCREYKRAFSYYDQANQTESHQYSASAIAACTQRITQGFDINFFAQRADYGCAELSPIFIVGMPRCGSSLLERILSSHSQIAGAGEVFFIRRLIKKITATPQTKVMLDEQRIAALTKQQSVALAHQYWQAMQNICPKAIFTVDKMLFNFRYLSFIRLLFPYAKIIHCLRHPLDVCLSCYFHYFEAEVSFASSLKNLQHFYSNYYQIMQHWQAVLPVKMLTIKYEDLLANSTDEIARLLDYCGVEQQQACLQFYKNPAPIKTSSVWQARQQLYDTAKYRWRHYKNQLQELTQTLSAVCEDLQYPFVG